MHFQMHCSVNSFLLLSSSSLLYWSALPSKDMCNFAPTKSILFVKLLILCSISYFRRFS
ncbi:hypothetical protein GGI43DRAFT_389255 [Trichoderma evansii]